MTTAPEMFPLFTVERAATISEDRRYRYDLTRRWADGPAFVWVMLNPSTADGTSDDATLRRVISFSRAGGAAAAVVVNLFAYRSRTPQDLLKAGDPIGPRNDAYIRRHAEGAARVILGWGAFTLQNWRHKDRPKQVLASLTKLRPDGVWCLERTAGGHPRHPLYIKAAATLRRY